MNEYTESDYNELEAALIRSESVAFGRPDLYQYHQNELSKQIASFLLRPWLREKEDLLMRDIFSSSPSRIDEKMKVEDKNLN